MAIWPNELALKLRIIKPNDTFPLNGQLEKQREPRLRQAGAIRREGRQAGASHFDENQAVERRVGDARRRSVGDN